MPLLKDLLKENEINSLMTKSNQPEASRTENKIHFVDESYRRDDNSGLSTIAMDDDQSFNDPLMPGIGVEETAAAD